MRKFFIFAVLTLGVLVCSCTTEIVDFADFDGLEATVTESGISEADNSTTYVSWVKVDRQGMVQQSYETELAYTKLLTDNDDSPIYADGIKGECRLLPGKNELIG